MQCKTMKKKIVIRTKATDSMSASAVFQDFVQNTSLLGIQHFLRNRSFVWLLAYLICVAMSIIQSWSVTVNFFQQKSYHSITVASKTLLPFPSLTICTGTVLREDFNFSSIPGFNDTVYKLLNKCSDEDDMHKMGRIIEHNIDAVQQYMRTLSEERRLELGLNLTRVLNNCRYGMHPCNISNPSEFHVYSCPYYGNCFTFNPAYDESSAQYLSPSDYLHMNFRFPSGGYWLTMRSNPKMGIQIHPPGTAPFLDGPDVIDVFAGEIATVYITLQSETLSLKKSSTTIPSCVDSDDETYRLKSIFYRERSPYLYSQEACLKTCTQERFANCGAILPNVPVQPEEYERGKIITFYPECQIGPIDMEMCNCPIPCRSLEYTFLRDHNDIYNIPCKKEKVPVSHSRTEPDMHGQDNGEYENEAKFIINFRSNIYQKIEEELSCGLFEYLGILGGNMSLWIGLCVISLLELFELFIKVAIAAIRSSKIMV